MSVDASPKREEPPDDGTALVSIPDSPQVPVDLVVARLFPWPTQGQTFLARFKERASGERCIMPDEPANVLIICTKSIATLGEALGLSYDTTQKYVALFQALGLLRKRKFMGRIAFILSLGIYQPPHNLEANLDYLLQRSKAKKSRTKYHGLVRDVKQRCLVYGLIDQGFTDALRQLHSLVQLPPGISRSKLEQRLAQAQHLVSTMIAQAMTAHLPTGDALLQNLPELPGMRNDDARQQASESTQQETTKRRKSGMPLTNLPGQTPSRDAEPQEVGWVSPQPGAPARFAENNAASNLSERPGQVDSSRQSPSIESIQTGSSGRRAFGQGVQNRSNPPTQVDSSLPDQHSESIQPTHSGRFSTLEGPENLPTQAMQVDSQDIANVNVGNIIKSNINVNVEVVADWLCRLFNEPTSKQGIYSRLFRDGCNQAEVIHAAAIFALVHFHRDKTITNPAAVFIARCKAYHAQGVPEEAARLLAEYGDLTYQQLLDKAQWHASHATQSSAPARAAPSGWSTPPTLPPIPRPTDLAPRIPLKSSGGMTRESALRLRAQIAHDRRVGMCRTGIAPLQDRTYAVLLDNTVSATRVRQAAVYTANEWQERHQEVCATLFASSGGSVLAKRHICSFTHETEGGKRP